MASPVLKQTRSPSLRATAAGLGVSLSTLQNAIATGRVSVGADGRVPDLERARAQLAMNTLETHPRSAPLREQGDAEAPVGGESLVEARRRKAVAEADLKETQRDLERAKLIPAVDVERRMSDVFAAARAHLLALPSRAKQTLPHLTASDLEALESVVREALTELADGKVRA